MKKLILGASALLISLGMVNAQGWSSTGVHDDFATSTEYSNGPNGEGIHWFETTGATALTVTRNTGSMTVAATNAGGCTTANSTCYPSFGVQWGSDASSNPYTIDLSGGANITFDIENTGVDDAFIVIQVGDINNVITQIEPNISDVADTSTWGYAGPPTNHYRRKALNGFTLGASSRITVTIDLSSVPGAIGGLTAGAFTCSKPADCPVTSYAIDITKIKDILFLVNSGKSDINISEGDGDPTSDTYIAGSSITPFTGNIKVYDFKVGNFVLAVKDAVVENSLSVYPNPADEALTVSFKSSNDASVVLTDIVGNKVYSTNGIAGDNNISVNTSNLTTGIYILNITTESGKVARKVNIK